MTQQRRTSRTRWSTHSDAPVDLLIAGAGICGLVAARLAQTAGLRVMLLEAKDQLGGNAQAGGLGATPYPKGSSVLCTYDQGQRNFLKQLGVELSPRHRVFPDRVLVEGKWCNFWSEAGRAESDFERQIDEFASRCERVLTNAQGKLGLTVHDLPSTALDWDRVSFEDAFRDLSPRLRKPLATILRSDAARGGSQVSALASMVDLLVCLRGEGFVLPGGNHAIVRALHKQLRKDAACFPVEIRTSTCLAGLRETERGVVASLRNAKSGLSQSVDTSHVLLAMPSHATLSIPGLELSARTRRALSTLSHAPYTMVHLFLDHCPLDSYVFHMSPNTRWVTDVLLVNALGDRNLRSGADLPSVLTAYVPGASAARLAMHDEAQFLERVRADIRGMFPERRALHAALQAARTEISHFAEAMSAPAPGQVRELYQVNPDFSPRVHYAHSDIGFFSAMGAIEVARASISRLLGTMAPQVTPAQTG